MSHMIMEDDRMMSANMKRPWHYDETADRVALVQDAPTSWDALKLSFMDWDVVSTPVVVNNVPVEGYKANVRADTGRVLGIVSNRYKIVQNREAFAFVDAILEQKDVPVCYETCGSLENGQRVWMLANMPKSLVLGDEVENYLFFTNAHNGKSGITAGITQVRVVCNNTLQLALGTAKRSWTTKHIGDMQAKKAEAIMTLQLASKYVADMSVYAETMAAKKISKSELDYFLDMLFPMEEEGTDREKNNISYCRNNILDIYMGKDDLANFRGTAWGLYNATADFVSNTKPVRTTKTYREKLFASFLDGNVVLQQAQKILMTA